MRTLTKLFFMTALSFSLGCSGGDGDGGGPAADASTGGTDSTPTGPDAGMQGSGAEGQACAASEADPTGGCPTDYACLNAGGPESCFKLCPTANGAECTGYDGPGSSACIISITDQQMNPVGAACGTICGDTTGMVPGCTGGACDGTCPGVWSCEDNLDRMGNPTGVKICQ